MIGGMKEIRDLYWNKDGWGRGCMGRDVMIVNRGCMKNVGIGEYWEICGRCGV